MIIVKLKGGLGNQMFQYAMGRNLAIERNDILKLDKSSFETQVSNNTKRSYGLYFYNIVENIALPEEIYDLTNQSLAGSRNKRVITENVHYSYNPIISDAKDIYLIGYWQNENYFSRIQQDLQKEFSLKSFYDTHLMDQVNKKSSVAVHVRRGDYFLNPKYSMYQVCDRRYYISCIDIMKEYISNPFFFFFSDDPEWVQENIVPQKNFAMISGENENIDLWIMQNCKHFILSNSTFGWWGAWLSKSEDKIVLAPDKWVNNDIFNNLDPVVSTWIKMKT